MGRGDSNPLSEPPLKRQKNGEGAPNPHKIKKIVKDLITISPKKRDRYQRSHFLLLLLRVL
jgi:hypothetical protein